MYPFEKPKLPEGGGIIHYVKLILNEYCGAELVIDDDNKASILPEDIKNIATAVSALTDENVLTALQADGFAITGENNSADIIQGYIQVHIPDGTNWLELANSGESKLTSVDGRFGFNDSDINPYVVLVMLKVVLTPLKGTKEFNPLARAEQLLAQDSNRSGDDNSEIQKLLGQVKQFIAVYRAISNSEEDL